MNEVNFLLCYTRVVWGLESKMDECFCIESVFIILRFITVLIYDNSRKRHLFLPQVQGRAKLNLSGKQGHGSFPSHSTQSVLGGLYKTISAKRPESRPVGNSNLYFICGLVIAQNGVDFLNCFIKSFTFCHILNISKLIFFLSSSRSFSKILISFLPITTHIYVTNRYELCKNH